MHFTPLSTNHTAIGTFRKGVIYSVDEKEPKIKSMVLPKLKGEKNPNGPFLQLTDAQVAERKKEVQEFAVQAQSEVTTLGEAKKQLKVASGELIALKRDLTDAKKQISDLKAANDKLVAELAAAKKAAGGS